MRLNEVLARNSVTVVTNGESPDLHELFNAGSATINLSGMGLTDDPATSYKFTFAPGTTLGSGRFMILYSEASGSPTHNLGFGFNQSGDAVYLFDSVANGGGLIDSVSFGPQIVDYSIGRLADGSSGLCQPTFGSVNAAQPTGDIRTLRINEWLASGQATMPDDFLELYNPDLAPVAMGGLYLSEERRLQ